MVPGSALPRPDFRSRGSGNIQDLSRVLERAPVRAVPREPVLAQAHLSQEQRQQRAAQAGLLRARPQQGALPDDQPDGQTGGGAGRGERERRGGARVHEGYRLHQPVQEHEGGARLPHALGLRRHGACHDGEVAPTGQRPRVVLEEPQHGELPGGILSLWPLYPLPLACVVSH